MQELQLIAEVSGVDPLVLLAAVVWSLVWKGFALWYSARDEQKWWFAALLVVNTVGLLEILYIFVIRGRLNKKEVLDPSKVNLTNGQ